jgi:hypothetical protein
MKSKVVGKTAVNEPKILWSPQPKQSQALECNAFELFFGGAAGGGKSDFLLADFTAGINTWRDAWKGILFRRTYDELQELHARARQLYIPLGAKLTDKGRVYQFPTGATLRMSYLEHDNDVERYQGHQYPWIAFDELGNYPTDYAWRYMVSRCRSPSGAPCYIRGTGNPGGAGHAWIKNRFIDGYVPGKTYKTTDGKTPITRCFIPSTIEDNKILMENDPGYVERMKMLPQQMYRALRFGDWDVFAGQVFDEFRRAKHVVKPFALEQGKWVKFYAFDWGYAKPFALTKLAVNGDGKVVQYGEIYGCVEGEYNKGIRMPSDKAAALTHKDAIVEGVTTIVCDPAIWNKDDNYPSAGENLEAVGFNAIRANNARLPGWDRLHELLQAEDEHSRPMLQIFETCLHTIRTLPSLTPSDTNPEDVNSKLEDHLADALRYGCMSDYVTSPLSWLRRQGGGLVVPKKFDVLQDNGF